MSNIVGIPMPFSCRGVCLIPYCGPMPYTIQFPAYRIGGRVEPCLIRGYALSEVCLKRVSTVYETDRCVVVASCALELDGTPAYAT